MHVFSYSYFLSFTCAVIFWEEVTMEGLGYTNTWFGTCMHNISHSTKYSNLYIKLPSTYSIAWGYQCWFFELFLDLFPAWWEWISSPCHGMTGIRSTIQVTTVIHAVSAGKTTRVEGINKLGTLCAFLPHPKPNIVGLVFFPPMTTKERTMLNILLI